MIVLSPPLLCRVAAGGCSEARWQQRSSTPGRRVEKVGVLLGFSSDEVNCRLHLLKHSVKPAFPSKNSSNMQIDHISYYKTFFGQCCKDGECFDLFYMIPHWNIFPV